jgi:hypothetical protein
MYSKYVILWIKMFNRDDGAKLFDVHMVLGPVGEDECDALVKEYQEANPHDTANGVYNYFERKALCKTD